MGQDTCLPSTRHEAKLSDSVYYYTGRPCKNGHTAKRLTKSGKCIECNKLWCQKFAAANPTRHADSYAKLKSCYPDKLAAQLKKVREWAREVGYARKWRNQNREKARYYVRTRQIALLKAFPPWADVEAIKYEYLLANYVSRLTGIPHEVDHIIPIKNPTVCGLHVPWNLRTITKEENRLKGNKLGDVW